MSGKEGFLTIMVYMFNCKTKMSSTTVCDWTQCSCRGLEIKFNLVNTTPL